MKPTQEEIRATYVAGVIAVCRQDLLEIPIDNTPAQGNQYKFQLTQNNFLNVPDVIIYGIEVLSTTEMAVSPTGRTLITAANVPNLILNIFERGQTTQFGRNYPATRLRPSLYDGITQYFNPRPIDLNLSYVQMVAAGTMASGESICLNVYYKKVGEQ